MRAVIDTTAWQQQIDAQIAEGQKPGNKNYINPDWLSKQSASFQAAELGSGNVTTTPQSFVASVYNPPAAHAPETIATQNANPSPVTPAPASIDMHGAPAPPLTLTTGGGINFAPSTSQGAAPSNQLRLPGGGRVNDLPVTFGERVRQFVANLLG
jgi:hypothetical protein